MSLTSKRIIEERRFKLIRFDSPDIKNFFIVDDENGYPLHIKNNELPDDHILLSFSFIDEGRNIICLIASETFDRVRDDDIIDMIIGRNKYNVYFLQMGQFKIRQ